MAANESPERSEQPQAERPAGGIFNFSNKTLIIGGAGGGVALFVVIAVVALLVTGVFGGGGGASGGGDILGYIPGDAEFVVIEDIRTQANTEGLEDYAQFRRGGDDTRDTKVTGMDDDNIELFAVVYGVLGGEDTLWIAQGNFEFDNIREELDDGLECEDDDYRGFEIWECPGRNFPTAVAVFEKDRYVVIASQRQSDLEQLLTDMRRYPDRLANAKDSDIRRILNTVGDGWMRIAVADACAVDRCAGFGMALKGDDSDSIDVSFGLMFGSERAAEAMEGEIEIDDFVTSVLADFALDLDISDVKADGDFVIVNGAAAFIDPDDVRSANVNSGRGSESRDRDASAQPAPTGARQASPAAPAATLAPLEPTSQAPSRSQWLEDCADVSLDQSNRLLARHQQITSEDAYEYCQCLYGYFEKWDGPPSYTVSDVMDGSSGVGGALSFVDLMSDARGYCSGW